MKFGKLFDARVLKEQGSSQWRYLDYGMLKEMIRVGVARAEFDEALAAETKAVDDCYSERFLSFDDVFEHEPCDTASKLRQYVVL